MKRIDPTELKAAQEMAKNDRSSGLIGTIDGSLSVDELEDLFGPSTSGDKTTHEWAFKIDGVLVTVYDYKGHRWHVGGQHRIVRDLFENEFGFEVTHR